MISDYNNQSASYAQVQQQQAYINNAYNNLADQQALMAYNPYIPAGGSAGFISPSTGSISYTTTSTAGPSAVHAIYSYGTTPGTAYVNENGVAIATQPKEYAEQTEFIDLEDL